MPSAAAARVLLHAQGLLDDPARKATPASVYRQIESMGFVQLDSINVVERAHHLTLAARFDDYRPEHLRTLLEKKRRLFEHWTHDASVIPTVWFRPWRTVAKRFTKNPRIVSWCRRKMGNNYGRVLRQVLERIRKEGPLASRDFEHARKKKESQGWWNWKPHKAALEFLWWRGDLSVARREGFQKVYELTERFFPDLFEEPELPAEKFVEWACKEAFLRLGFATPGEIAGFFGVLNQQEARAWCKEAAASEEVVPVLIQGTGDAPPQKALALPDWKRRAARADRARAGVAQRVRLLAPFDPILRDRKRAKRLFDFDYRFEAFVPAAKRRYGYYVLPVLRGDRLIGRTDVKLHRRESRLEVKGLWWEPGVRPTRNLAAAFQKAADRLARLCEADTVDLAGA